MSLGAPVTDPLPAQLVVPAFDSSVCEVCGGQSGGKYAGVAAIPGVPMSITWCTECLDHDCAPAFVLEHDFIFVANGDLANLAEWAVERETWSIDEQKYISFKDFTATIPPEHVKSELEAYNKAANDKAARGDS